MKNVIYLHKTITYEAVVALTAGEVRAVRVAEYTDVKTCEAITERMLKSKHFGMYKNAPKIGRVGKALFEAIGSAADLKAYFDGAAGWMDELRIACAPYANPIDRLRLEADVIWPGGARIARLGGRPTFAGLLRVFDEGSFAEPHEDHLIWDVGPLGFAKDAALQAQLAANVYLMLPRSGGELAIWSTGLSRKAYEQARNPGSYGVRESALSGKPMVIRPRQGELVLFRSTDTHAVLKGEGGKRVTWSCFIGSNGPDLPLSFWS